jgi:hypothetical protein
MKRAKHAGEHAVNCPSCITAAERQRMPWHGSYHDVFSRTSHGPTIERKHAAALKRAGAKLASGHAKFLVPLLLAAMLSSAAAANKTCDGSTLTPAPLTATGPTPDSILARAVPALLVQVVRTAGTATVALEVSCDHVAWAPVGNGTMNLSAATPTTVASVVAPACSYRANVTACAACSLTVLYACAGAH